VEERFAVRDIAEIVADAIESRSRESRSHESEADC